MIRETMKKYRDTTVQGVALTVNNTGIREQGFNKTDIEIVPRQFVRDTLSSGAVKRQFLQIARRIFFRHFSIKEGHISRIGMGVFELLSNASMYCGNSPEFTGPMYQGVTGEDLLNQGATGSGHAHYEYG